MCITPLNSPKNFDPIFSAILKREENLKRRQIFPKNIFSVLGQRGPEGIPNVFFCISNLLSGFKTKVFINCLRDPLCIVHIRGWDWSESKEQDYSEINFKGQMLDRNSPHLAKSLGQDYWVRQFSGARGFSRAAYGVGCAQSTSDHRKLRDTVVEKLRCPL